MKLSVSIPDEDLAFIDSYASEHQVESRSAVIHRALTLLRLNGLGDAYAEAWRDWSDADAAVWDATVGDGLA